MNLFKVVPGNFFSILASANKEVYFDCIVITYRAYENASVLGVDKKLVIELLSDYFQENTVELEDEEEDNDSQGKAHQVLRKMVAHGWIEIDANNDYEELITFKDYAITITETLMKMNPTIVIDDGFDDFALEQSTSEFKGYIYTIYTLLANQTDVQYGHLLDAVYKNTKAFMNSLRRLDATIKEYIKSIVDTVEVKDLMENLIKYKVTILDDMYYRLKTSDNVNKFKLFIINALTELSEDEEIISIIASTPRYNNFFEEEAPLKVMADIAEIIDMFNSLDQFIDEIDNKNKTYLNTTIAKVQFLLNNEADISGRLQHILKFVTESNKKGQLDKAMKVVDNLATLPFNKSISVFSLYTQRGEYKKFEPLPLDTHEKEVIDLDAAFFDEFKSIYSEKLVREFTKENMIDNVFRASLVLKQDASLDDILMLLFAAIYADQMNGYKVRRLSEYINHDRYLLRDFEIYIETREK